MLIINLSPPIDRPALFYQDVIDIRTQLVKTGPSIYWPDMYCARLGLQFYANAEWVSTMGYDNIPDGDLNVLARPFHAPPCKHSCFLFAGSSLVACLACCRRR
jgi:hypothetical protein